MSGRKFLKSTQILKNPNWTMGARKKIDANWRKQSEPTMPEIKKTVRSMIRREGELKFFDTNIALANNTTTGTVTSLTEVPQGATDSARIGDRIKTVNLELRCSLISGDLTQTQRLVVVFMRDNQVPTVADIFQNSNFDDAITHDNVQGKYFQVLYDKAFSQTTVGENLFKFVTIKLKLGRNIQYVSGTTGAVSGKIYLISISDSGAIPHPTIKTRARLRYTDS